MNKKRSEKSIIKKYLLGTGYFLLVLPNKRRVFEHRYVMEQHLNRTLSPIERVREGLCWGEVH